MTWHQAAGHLLSGGVPSLAVSVVVWFSHARTRRHITRVTAAQTRELTESKIPGGADDRPPASPGAPVQRPHPAVPHPLRVLARLDQARYEKRLWGRFSAVNDWTATHLGIVFGSVWVVWVFFIWPLIAQFMGTEVQIKTSYYAQSWVQLFALPLFVYIGNKLQRSSDAQSEAVHQALTHIATVSDQNKVLIGQNTALTAEVHRMVSLMAAQAVPGGGGGITQGKGVTP